MTIKYTEMEVKLLDHMGSDWAVANDARVSFSGFNETNNELPYNYSEEKAIKLINYLASHGHTSPFRHSYFKFKCKAPLFVVRQLGKHQVGLSWNEESRRYIDSEPEFYKFDTWRKRPENNIKQGSSGYLEFQYFPEQLFEKLMLSSVNTYLKLLEINVSPEQARAVLPQNVMINWVWSGSLLAFAHMYNLRSEKNAQAEVQHFAKLVRQSLINLAPHSWAALVKNKT